MARKIFRSAVIGKIEQGSIINNCIASNYVGKSVKGVVITPRCDIENAKVNSIHYLPIVSFLDWLETDGWQIFRGVIEKNYRSKMKDVCNRNKIALSIVDNILKINENAIISLANKAADQEILRVSISTLKDLAREQLSYKDKKKYFSENHKHLESLLCDIKENKKKDFYLIEGWESNSTSYYVVLLREIRQIDSELASKIGRGLECRALGEDVIVRNQLYYEPDGLIFSESVLMSPFIEHLVQQFLLNFNRIGIEDHDDDFTAETIKKINEE